MTETTFRAVKAIIDADLTLDATRKKAVLNALKGEAATGGRGGREPPAKILKGVEVARMLGVCRKTVQNWRTRGLLVPFVTGRNATGYLESDVLAFEERFREVPSKKAACVDGKLINLEATANEADGGILEGCHIPNLVEGYHLK